MNDRLTQIMRWLEESGGSKAFRMGYLYGLEGHDRPRAGATLDFRAGFMSGRARYLEDASRKVNEAS